MDAVLLRRRLHGLSMRSAQLVGTLNADQQQFDETTSNVALAKGRMNLAEEMSRLFDAMQQRSNMRSVGAFENLLSAVLDDVLPQEGRVRLLTEYKNNTTYLDVALEKNGGIEDIVDANGGAVTNVVCAGLRFAALSRTQNRRLMVLDEPDCWLKPERVPAFVDVISQVSADMGSQTFFITHHDPSFFEGKVNVVKFSADWDGSVQAQALSPLAKDWTDNEEPGIRGIELINVRRHEHTLVPCFPRATAFIGDNNLGKSTAIVTALKAVAYNESDDSIIRHGCTEAKIILHLEKGMRLEWSRAIKRSPAVLFKLYQGDEVIAEGRPPARNQSPEWVEALLKVQRVDDLDIQIGSQKSPVFLLNDAGPRRAQILSVGKESSHLKALMKRYEEVKATDREAAKAGELILARLKLRLTYLKNVGPRHADVEALMAKSEALLIEVESREKLSKAIAIIEQRVQSVAALEAGLKALSQTPSMPSLVDTSKLASLVETLDKGQVLSALPSLPALPMTPTLKEVTSLASLGQRISKANTTLAGIDLCKLALPIAPELKAQEQVGAFLAKLEKLAKDCTASANEQSTIGEQVTVAEQELRATQESLGACPLCGTVFPESHAHAH